MLPLAMTMTPAQIAPYLWQYGVFLGIIMCLWIFSIKSKGSHWGSLILCAVLVFIAGFRHFLHTQDTWVYVRSFEVISTGILHGGTYMEKGYVLYNYILSWFCKSPQIVLFSNAFLTIAGYYICYKKYSTNPFLSLVLFCVNSINGFVPMMNLSRQYLAVGIIMFSVGFIVKRNFILFLLGIIVAGNFHTSAYLAIILYFLYPIPFKLKYAAIGMIATAFLAFTPLLDLVMSLLQSTIMSRLLRLHEEGIKLAALANTVISFGIFSFCLWTFQRYKSSIRMNISPSFLLWSSLLTLCMFIISLNSHAFDRIALLFSGLNILALSNFICVHKATNRYIFVIGFLSVFIIYSCICFVYRPEWGMPIPFRFCF